MGIFVSKARQAAARSADLYDFLIRNHPDAVKVEGNSLVLRADHHISLKRGYCGYMDWKTGKTGSSVDYLMSYLGYSFQDAVIALTDGYLESEPSQNRSLPLPVTSERTAKTFVLPQKATTNRRLYAYLLSRGIDYSIISKLISEKLMYESIEGNIVFITPDGNYIEIRGTNTFSDRRCRRCYECPDYIAGDHGWCQSSQECHNYKSNAFHSTRNSRSDDFWYIPSFDGPCERVYICEAAIDAISLYQMHQKTNSHIGSVYVSISGVGNQKKIDRIKKRRNTILAVDNDPAGEECRDRNPELRFIIPKHKDWNEDLQQSYTGGQRR